MSDPTTADEPDVLEQPDETVNADGTAQPGRSEKEPVEADWRQTEPDDTLGLTAKDGDPMDETTPVDNLE
ncbi:hypothetical protein [Leifsonia sp. Leaf264]|uniref:hypothetical protein n=1 Tax=Leifsonia sp. Leaf264 TaxID=1736314 RepID=UPI0006FAF029|nr:hypothetical protein [Leifsonia sp. Leaf264]KQO96824.1 hypothetical protein ASF30_17215 [Leifsonia sp. Leaf264]